jgi:hypothetical protein
MWASAGGGSVADTDAAALAERRKIAIPREVVGDLDVQSFDKRPAAGARSGRPPGDFPAAA